MVGFRAVTHLTVRVQYSRRRGGWSGGVEWGGDSLCGVLDKRKNFHPAANHVKNGRWGREKLTKGFPGITKRIAIKYVMILMVVVANFGGGIFVSRWLWKEEATEGVLEYSEDTRVS